MSVPASIGASCSAPSRYSCVMTTLAEQLGISPTSAEPRTASISLPRRNCSIADSPNVSSTATRISVTRKMNTETCTVCEIALRMIDRTGVPSWEWE